MSDCGDRTRLGTWRLNDRLLFSATFTRFSSVLLDLLKQNQIRGAKPSNALKWKLLTMSHLSCFDHG